MTDTADISPPHSAALVTGGAKRIGRDICLALARGGYDVAIHCHSSRDAAEALVAEIEAMGRKSCVVQADLMDEAALKPLIADAGRALGPLSVLVNNASIFEDDRVGSLSRDIWDKHIQTNLRAPIVLAEAFAEQAPKGSAIVNLLDQRVLKPDPRFFSYALSRNGLWWATQTLAQALAPDIRVNGVGPGPTLASIHQSDTEFAAEARHVPLATSVDPSDIAATVLWLIGADKVTGQMIAVDSGQHLAWQTPDILLPQKEVGR